MAHEVFISYAVEDVKVANEVCRALEDEGVGCWIAPRDVPFGTPYELVILDAIESSRLLVLIFSAHSNKSQHVEREIRKAFEEGSTTQVFTLRLENVRYSKVLYYYLGGAQWLDATTPPLEPHLRRLVGHVRARLGRPPETAAGQTAEPPTRDYANAPEPSPVIPMPRASFVTHADANPVEDAPVKKRFVDGRKTFPVRWLGPSVALLLAVAAFAYWMAAGDDSNNVNSNNVSSPILVGDVGALRLPFTTPTPPRNINSPTPTPAQSPAPSPPRVKLPTSPDRVIKTHVDKVLAEHVMYPSEVRASVSGGVVTLTGGVPSGDVKQTIHTQIRGINGVKRVVNRIEITGNI